MPALALIPFGCLFLLFLILYHRGREQGIHTRVRIALLKAILITSFYGAFITEALSAFKWIHFNGILLSWLIPFVLLAAYTVRTKLFVKNTAFFTTALKYPARQPAYWFIISLLNISLLIAILYPPNNYDSLTYHMARVEHWRQNETISHYQTHILRQLILQPFAEWVILHFRTLTGGDRLANAVQLFFLAGCLVNVSLITRLLGGNAKKQMLSALLTCVIPMVMIQSNTTQNDIVVAFFILAFVYFTICAMRQVTRVHLLWAGLSLGLALLTKGTAYVFTILFIAWYGMLFITWYREPLKKLLSKALLLMIVPGLALIINSTHFYRNSFLTGSPLGNASASTANEGYEIKSLAMVGLKNVMNHLPVTPGVKYTVAKTAYSLGIDANDPKYHYTKMDLMATGFVFDEDYAQNFMHTLLIFIATLAFFRRKSLYGKPLNMYSLYFFTLAGTALLFTILLKWQPWSNRLETALFMLFSVFLAMEIGNWKKWMQFVCIIPTVVFGVAALLLSSNHPILPPSHSIFKKSYAYFMNAEQIFDCKHFFDNTPYTKIGIYIGADSPDYYYYKLLSNSASGKSRELKHVFVSNDSEMYLDNFVPEAIIYSGDGPVKFNYRGKEFIHKATFRKKLWIYVAN
jgi:hypothetical protein